MARTKTQKIIRYSIYGLLVVGILGVVFYGLVVRPLQIHNQKQNFDKAEASLDALATQIQDKIGKADETKKEKSCDRANLLSEKGPLSCDIAIYMLFTDKNALKATDLMHNVVALLAGSPTLKILGKPVTAFVPRDVYGGDQTIDQDSDDFANLNCGVQYIYPVIPKLDQPFKTTNAENLLVSLSCSGSATKEFYPLKD